MFELLHKFLHMDRRWIFVGMALAILLPMLVNYTLPFNVDERVHALYDEVEELPSGSTVLISADFDPASRPELEPFFRANLHHLFRKDVKVVMVTLWAYAPPLVIPILHEVAALYDKQQGKDYVFLGFKDGKELAIKAIGENIRATFPAAVIDGKEISVDDLRVMDGLKQAKDFPLLINVSAGHPGTREYVLQIQGQHNLTMISACTAVSGPDYIPFYKAGQLAGLSAGMPGSAQYEKLVWPDGPPEGTRDLATQAVNVLNLGHLFIIVLIVLGNVAYFATRPRQEVD